MKEKVEKLLDLCKQVDSIKDELSDRIEDVARRYATSKNHSGYGYPGKSATFDWTIEDDKVEVEWSDSWAYGGHDEGSFCFPVSYLYDEEALVKYEKSQGIEKQIADEQKEKKQRERDLLELQRLQKKLAQ